MALRMILVAMVVAMSLPIPNTSSCNQLLHEIKSEISAAAASIQNEWPQLQATSAEHKIEAALAAPVSIEKAAPEAEPKPAQLESPLELAFSVIVEEFARDAADHFGVAQAREHLDAIPMPMPDMGHPLPPAPDANELLAHQQALAVIDVPTQLVHRHNGPIGAWESEMICLIPDQEESLSIPVETVRVYSTGIGHWAFALDGVESDSMMESTLIENQPELQSAPLPEHWQEIAEVSQMETLPVQAQSAKPVVISKALRLTAEALAAWTQVVVRAY